MASKLDILSFLDSKFGDDNKKRDKKKKKKDKKDKKDKKEKKQEIIP